MKIQRFILSSLIGVLFIMGGLIVFAEEKQLDSSIIEHTIERTPEEEKKESDTSEISKKTNTEETSISTQAETIESETETSTESEISREDTKNKTTEPKEETLETTYHISRFASGDEFFKALSKDATKIAAEHDLYTSVMLAQAALESGFGTSSLSLEPHYNLFGIKGSYQGDSVSMATLEEAKGQMIGIQAGFRVYPSYKESMEDYAQLLRGGLPGNSSFYQGTWKSNASTYQEATKFLTGRYATDSQYDKKLNGIIEAYYLTQYDDGERTSIKDSQVVYREKTHIVEEGDTIDELVRDYDVTFEELREWNEKLVDSDNLVPGESVVIGKRKLKNHLLVEETDKFTVSGKDYQLPLKEAYQITSPFGERGNETHLGIDLAVPSGTLVGNVKDGQVVQTGFDPSAGNYVLIQHQDGLYSHYFHLSEIIAKNGSTIKQREVIGKVGSTGNSTGPHLHFAIAKAPWKEFINPTSILKF